MSIYSWGKEKQTQIIREKIDTGMEIDGYQWMSTFEKEMETDETTTGYKGESVIAAYRDATQEQRDAIDAVLCAMSGWGMAALIKKVQEAQT